MTCQPTRSWNLPLALALVLALAGSASAQSDPGNRWDADTVSLLARVPVQDGGRIKPLDSYARFKLLKLNGKRTCKNLAGERISSMEWLLDCLFFPEQARAYETFMVQTSEVIDALGLPHEDKKKRDWYSYDELAPGRAKLFELARRYEPIEPKERSPVQAQIVNLAYNLSEFEALLHFLNFARQTYPADRSPALTDVLPDAAHARFSDLVSNGPVLIEELHDLQHEGEEPASGQDHDHGDEFDMGPLGVLVDELGMRGQEAAGIALIPPPFPRDEVNAWLSPNDLLQFLRDPPVQQVALLRQLEDMVDSREDPERFALSAAAFQNNSQRLAELRGEYQKIDLEVWFYRCQFFYYGLVLYVLSFVLVAISWMRRSRWLTAAIVGSLGAGTLLLVTGIVVRCLIRGRPPVSTLYETILFITALAVIVSMTMEWINRRRIALALAAILGSAGLFLANKYEIKEGVDTMPSLVAVLDTNFWLATHVTTVTAGYSAGLLASAVAHVYLLGKLLGFRRGNTAFYAGLGRMVYGVVCFGLLFSIVGTILGGIWANDSWGRFWGWDPKENGALLIVLCGLSMLHARMGGYVRDHGFCMAAVCLGMVVAFSWWGVNLLGVGLHSYGFTSGIQRALFTFYGIEAIVLTLGAVARYRAGHRVTHA